MKPIAALLALMLAACSQINGSVARDEPRSDTVSLAGSWREVSRNGRITRIGYVLSMSRFSSFAVQKGCLGTGGMLEPLGGGQFRIQRYMLGFAWDKCAPWRSDPRLAPFDGDIVRLVRTGNVLVAEGRGSRVELRFVAPASV